VSRSLRVPCRVLAPGEFVLEPDTARYVTRVHRLGAGATFVAFDPGGRVEADVTILSVGREVRCQVGDVRASSAVADSGVTLIQALGKGDKPERVIRDATALGVERVVLCYSRRTVARPGERSPSRLDRWRSIAVEAARQSGRGDVPAIERPLPFDEALQGAAVVRGRRLCLVPAAPDSFGTLLRDHRRGEPLAVLIGPEGGFDDAEIVAAVHAGFELASFGRFVLRTETMAVAVLGALAGRE